MAYTRGAGTTTYRRNTRRLRKSSRYRQPNAGKALFAVFLVLASLCYIALASGLGKWIASQLIIPSLEGQGAGEESAAPLASATPEESATVDIELSEMTYYAVQLGAYAEKEAADTQAAVVQKRGGAGYIVQTDTYRVLAGGYATREEAENVQTQLEEQGLESYLYAADPVPAVSLRVTGTASEIECVRKGAQAWQNVLTALHTALRETQSGLSPMQSLQTAREEVQENLTGLLPLARQSGEVSAMYEYLQTVSASLSTLLGKDEEQSVALSAALQYTVLDTYQGWGKVLQTLANS